MQTIDDYQARYQALESVRFRRDASGLILFDLDTAALSATFSLQGAQLLSLQHKVRRVLTSYFPRRLNTREHDAWETMHAVIAYGLETDIHRDGPGGKLVNGAGWLCFNGSCANYRLLYVEDGRVMARQGVGVQGHFGQFLAILAQSQMPLSYPMMVEGKEFTVAKSDIDEQQLSTLSLMPANFGESMPAEEFQHLMGFLLSQQKKPE